MLHGRSVSAAVVGVFFFFFLPLPIQAQQSKPLPPNEAPLRMTLPEGFRATLFAGEPDVVQPIAFAFDDRGRLWVAECYSYPNWQKTGTEGKDRILIFEDKDGDGRFDTCKVFYDKAVNVSGIEVGFGGVWLCSTPNLVFIPDRNGDDVPDGPPEVVLDGWDVLKAGHNVFNSLTWGPDGWLYGCNGIQSNSSVGKPGTPEDKRVHLNCGVWRYHPQQRTFEAVAHGTTNPWGLDFDDLGQMFITNCVISHLWHVIPGAHFQRMYGQDINPHSYRLMESCADHIHWGGGNWQESRGGVGKHDSPGGGHAHVGAMVYLGDNWPDRYRNTLFTCNLHGNRVNNDLLERHGSGYVGRHGKDFLFANDTWFRGLAIHSGPDGGVFISDWTDTGECHNYQVVDRTNGRIYKVAYGQTKPFHGDLAKLSDAELMQLQLHKNDWHVRHARRLLQERAAANRLDKRTHASLLEILNHHRDATRQLRALWALHVTGGLDEPMLLGLLDRSEDAVRAWAVRLLLEDSRASAAVVEKLARLAREDPSAFVRLHLASGLQRIPPAERWPIAEGLIEHAEDAGDANLPLMVWYGIEPLAANDAERFLHLIERSRIPLVRELVARRSADRPAKLVELLARVDQPAIQLDVLHGLEQAYEGQRQVPMPAGWQAVYRSLAHGSSAQVRDSAMFLAVLFDDRDAVAALAALLKDRSAATALRTKALQALLHQRRADLVPSLQELLGEKALRGAALRALAAFDDPATPGLVLRLYPQLTEEEKSDAIQTLASRSSYALALLDSVEKGQVPRRDIGAFTVRQIQGLKNKQVNDRLVKVWGTLRPAAQEKATQMARYKALLTADYLKSADVNHGRVLYTRTCASCHVLFGEGGKIGPELTGSQRSNLDYLLENILDPSAVVPLDYQVTIVQTRDGRVVTGIIKQETEKVLTVQTQNEVLLVAKSDIEERAKSPVSMMPEGLLAKLSDEEVRDLIAYLESPTQVPLPPEKAK
jgi:putative membrane-bound dehydrogenase-like protein